MHSFVSHNRFNYYLSIAVISLYFTNISLTYLSYQVNDKIITAAQEKYFLRLEKKEKQNQQIKKIQETKNPKDYSDLNTSKRK